MMARPAKTAIFEQFAADGFTKMFGNPGTVEQGFLDVLEQREDIEYVLTLQESVAIGIADGYARALNRPGLIQLHAGVGLGNGIGMLYQAMRGHTPLLVVAGDAGVRYDAMNAQMSADLVSMAQPVTKWATRVLHPGSVLRVLRRAVKVAMTVPRGPVFVGLPMDVLDADTSEPAVPTVIPSQDVVPSAADLDRAASALQAARDPIVLIGDGVSDTGAQAELTRVAELLGAPVWGADSAEMNMDTTHPLYRGQLGHMFGASSQARVQDADVVLIVGTYVFPEVFPLLDSPFRKDVRLIHIDLDVNEIAKNFPVDIPLAANPKPTLAALAERLSDHGRLMAAELHSIRSQRNQQPPDGTLIELFTAELAKQAPADLVVFDEALTASPAVTRFLPARVPGSYHATRGGSMGVGIPGAIGIKLARPEAEVVGFTGDGGIMYTEQALWTAARLGVAAKFVVCNNHRYRLLDQNIDQYWRERGIPGHGYPSGFDLSKPEIDFAALAAAHGVPGLRVDKTDQIESAIEQMLAADGPFLIDLNTE
ncbi:MAG: thiamine pyrophosphate-binding protein [Streptosporangiaceae bacterium]|nr:thiamine pyrophosphate-binding protein [Streptosporangiaceae bacterium]